MTEYSNFAALDIRVGSVVSAMLRNDLRNPAMQLEINFGDEIGMMTSSAQITDLYNADMLIGRKIVAIINFETRQIGNIFSECLVLGFNTDRGVVLIEPDRDIALGSKLA